MNANVAQQREQTAVVNTAMRGTAHSAVPLSVLIPARDEERNIRDCIASVAWAAEVIVLDSFSTDRTLQISAENGARIIQREFTNFSDHKNWALDNIDFRCDWILLIDADERVTPQLAAEIEKIVLGTPGFAGYYIARQNRFAGKWIKHGGWFPDWQLRLVRRGRARYEPRIVHEHMLLDGAAGFLKNALIHHDYKGIERYFDRHNTYSSMEAIEVYRALHRSTDEGGLRPALFSKGPERRRFLKHLAYRYLPARALFKFLWMYVVRAGFLDGRMGFRFCLLHTFYEYQISLKLEELRDPASPLHQKYREYL